MFEEKGSAGKSIMRVVGTPKGTFGAAIVERSEDGRQEFAKQAQALANELDGKVTCRDAQSDELVGVFNPDDSAQSSEGQDTSDRPRGKSWNIGSGLTDERWAEIMSSSKRND